MGERVMRHRIVVGWIVSLVVLAGIAGPRIAAAEVAAQPAASDTFVPPADLPTGWYARIETSLGRIVAQLLPDQAPRSVAYFAALAEGRMEWLDPVTGQTSKAPYYDGIVIYKLDAGRQFDTGDRNGSGYGTPAFFVPPEDGHGPINFSYAGRLGMTRLNGGRISAVAFFVTAIAEPWLNAMNPCFGRVVAGLDVVQALTVASKTYPAGLPFEPPIVERVRIFSVGQPPPLPEPVPYTPERIMMKQRESPYEAPKPK
jgi:peptidyl-prolyl cis-trans isomerase A (cyclophilin A)